MQNFSEASFEHLMKVSSESTEGMRLLTELRGTVTPATVQLPTHKAALDMDSRAFRVNARQQEEATQREISQLRASE